MRGLGIDRHLFGLFIVAKWLKMDPMPQMFQDKVVLLLFLSSLLFFNFWSRHLTLPSSYLLHKLLCVLQVDGGQSVQHKLEGLVLFLMMAMEYPTL